MKAPNWNPYLVYTWTSKQLKAWYLEYGSSAFYDGALWKPEKRALVSGLYEINFVEV